MAVSKNKNDNIIETYQKLNKNDSIIENIHPSKNMTNKMIKFKNTQYPVITVVNEENDEILNNESIK